ncbi:hypothetical protein [Scytonema hofmannii]|uniref:hypothetical protein n=1 Tax=Scytonema hofmannii TaxID=34078 RepID=UPI0003481538|nr:hypothetical protein [Scytonema hofmannii]
MNFDPTPSIVLTALVALLIPFEVGAQKAHYDDNEFNAFSITHANGETIQIHDA